jgi:DNA-binding NarL/FixJ family response regulator
MCAMTSDMGPFATAAKRVLIADDHPLYRDALRAIVPQACPAADLREAACQDAVLREVISDATFDLIVLDLNLPGAVGLSCLTKVRAIAPLTPILVVSAIDDPSTMSDVIKAGGTGYVPKSAQRQMLIDAIRVIMGGGTYLPLEGMMALRESRPPLIFRAKSDGRKGHYFPINMRATGVMH